MGLRKFRGVEKFLRDGGGIRNFRGVEIFQEGRLRYFREGLGIFLEG